MRKRSLLALAGTVAAVSLTVAVPASAATAVLSAGGSDLAVGSTITSPLASGTSATFYSSTTGTSGVKCTGSDFTAGVTSNPAAPGTAGISLTGQTFSGCSSNVTGVTGVNSISVGVPVAGTVSSGGAVALGSVQATISLKTLLGNINCTYTASGLNGTAANADHSITFTNQAFSKSSGSSLCFSTAYFSAKYASVTSGGVAVDVN